MDQNTPTDDAELPLDQFFAGGVTQNDVPALAPLTNARGLLNAFVTVFRGGESEILIRLLVMREIGARPDAPRWSPQELEQHFAYLDAVKLRTVLNRLREFGLLLWDAEDRTWQLSGAARVALSALANVLALPAGEDADLAYITSQVAAGQAMGKPSLEALNLLLTKYRELQQAFDDALVSGSEFRIRQAAAKFDAIEATVQKGNDILRALMKDGELAPAMHRNAQAIGQAQSRLLRMHAAFARTLHALELQSVALGGSGLSSSDVAQWLRTLNQPRLAALGENVIGGVLPLPFAMADLMLDVAEYELLERERAAQADTTLPPPCDAPHTAEMTHERHAALERYISELGALQNETPLADAVVRGGYALSAYRLSLLSLIGDPESAEMRGPIAELARLPLTVTLLAAHESIARDEVAQISRGTIVPVQASLPARTGSANLPSPTGRGGGG
ncbi:MAG: hypothetical protein FJY56_04195 [Betaproteobacteria bacterium]|nr:hypothetical protein [Betaproteobacteria bacterium]